MQFTYDMALDMDNMRKDIDQLKHNNILLTAKVNELENKLEEANREMNWAIERLEDNIHGLRISG